MLRNRELWPPLAITACLAVSSAAVCGVLGGWAAGLAGGLFSILTGGLWFGVTTLRYTRLRELGEYLAGVYAGGELLDIRDNREGELSLLKNDLYKITVTLKQQSVQLEEDKAFLQKLMGSISHQLRTPLTGMLVMADLLARSDLPEEKRIEFTGRLTAQLERMQWLLERLLTLSRLDAGCLDLECSLIEPSALIERAIAPVRVALELRQQNLSVDCSARRLWQGDEKWTAEAVTNLLKNASEHAPQGSTISLILRQDALSFRIIVEDEGIGIAEGDMPHLFERFYRGANATPGSAGIGLALAYELARAQGGNLTAENIGPGRGARFILQLPMRQDPL